MSLETVEHGVVVTGTGTVPLRPDVVRVWFAAEVIARSVSEALQRCSSAMASMAQTLGYAGIPEPDRQTSDVSLRQEYDHNGRPRGWIATQGLKVRLVQLEGAGELINATMAAGGDAARLRSLQFDVDRTGERFQRARVEARRRAFADARAAAEQYAELAGRRLGVVMAIRERDYEYPLTVPMAQSFAGATPGNSVPMESGEVTVTETVEVRWELVS